MGPKTLYGEGVFLISGVFWAAFIVSYWLQEHKVEKADPASAITYKYKVYSVGHIRWSWSLTRIEMLCFFNQKEIMG